MDKPTMTPTEVGKVLGRGYAVIEEGIRTGKLPFGVAYPMPSDQYVYIIPRKAFERWMSGEVTLCNTLGVQITTPTHTAAALSVEL